MRLVDVWDVATRAFHWALVLLVLTCFLTGDDKGLSFTVHAYVGYLVLMLLLYRLGLGFVGSKHTRFSDFAYSWADIKAYGMSLLRFRPTHFVGHNPIGGVMVFAMLAMLAATGLTGLTIVLTRMRWLEGIHEAFGTVMEIMVVVHVAGVLVEQVLTRENLVRAMISGQKNLPDERALSEPPLVSAWRSGLLAIAVAAIAIYVYRAYDFGGAVAAFPSH